MTRWLYFALGLVYPLIAPGFLLVPISAIAQESAQQLYSRLVDWDARRVMRLQGGPPDPSFDIWDGSKIEDKIEELAKRSDVDGMYYFGVVRSKNCVKRESDQYERLRQSFCENSIYWYRRAAEKGDYPAAFALGTAYREGLGVAKSELLAIDWYYKAGRLALEKGDRDGALRALEEMSKVNPRHPFSIELEGRLYPKDQGPIRKQPQRPKPSPNA